VLNGLAPETGKAFAEANLRPVIGSIEEFSEWQAFCTASGWRGEAALHVDTGMNRLGLSFEAAQSIALKASGLSLLMSHLACADEPDHPLNARQMAEFRAVRAMFPGIPGSLANSSGIFLGPDAHHDLVRPGASLYGVNPTPRHDNPMRPVIRLRGRIVQIRTVPEGQTVGYGATWTAKRPSRIAIISVGYADGFMRAASARDDKPGAEVMVDAKRCPLAGLISMDLMAVDVTDLPEGMPKRDDFAILIGDGISVDDLAARTATIGYEVLTSLGKRYARVYKGG
jgi:alanine racemase